MVRFTIRQTTTEVPQTGDAPLYRVANQVISAIGASPSVFVHRTDTGAFDHYANAGDMDRWSDSREEALMHGHGFYRLDTVSRTWTSLGEVHMDLDTTLRRVRALARELRIQRAPINGTRDTIIEVD